jgi:hypothetical protein
VRTSKIGPYWPGLMAGRNGNCTNVSLDMPQIRSRQPNGLRFSRRLAIGREVGLARVVVQQQDLVEVADLRGEAADELALARIVLEPLLDAGSAFMCVFGFTVMMVTS